jgi:hypothetical protein
MSIGDMLDIRYCRRVKLLKRLRKVRGSRNRTAHTAM